MRCRPAASDQPEFAASVQEGVQELQFGLAVDQAGAELAEHGVVEAGIGQFQAQGVLPVDAAADGVGGLAVGEALDVLEDGGQGQPRGRGGRLSAGGEQVGELVVAVERSEFVGDAEAKVPLGKAAWATRRVSSGIGCSSSGRNDIRLLLPALVGAREQPNRSADQGPAEFATSVNVGLPEQEVLPRRAALPVRRLDREHLAPPSPVDPDRDLHRPAADDAGLARLLVPRVEDLGTRTAPRAAAGRRRRAPRRGAC